MSDKKFDWSLLKDVLNKEILGLMSWDKCFVTNDKQLLDQYNGVTQYDLKNNLSELEILNLTYKLLPDVYEEIEVEIIEYYHDGTLYDKLCLFLELEFDKSFQTDLQKHKYEFNIK